MTARVAPGGIPLAVISRCGRYRYALRRTWDAARPAVLFLGLNPSTADASRDDPTIRRMRAYAQAWGFGTLLVGNLFAWRATARRELRQVARPVGPWNDRWLVRLVASADTAVAAWGNDGALHGRGEAVRRRWPGLRTLGLTARGAPRHPLYLPGALTPIPWP